MSNVKPARNQAKNQPGTSTEKPVNKRERVNLGCGPLIIGISLLALLAVILPHASKKPLKTDKHSEDHTAPADLEMSGRRTISTPIPQKTTPKKPAANAKNQETTAPTHKTTEQRSKSETIANAKPSPATAQTPRNWLDRIKAFMPWESSTRRSSDQAAATSASGRSRQTSRKSDPEKITEPQLEKKPLNLKAPNKDHQPAQKKGESKTPVKLPSSDQGASRKPEEQADQKSGSAQIPVNKKEPPAPLSATPGKNPPAVTGSKPGTKDHVRTQDKQPVTNPDKATANREEALKPLKPEAHEKASSNNSDAANPSSPSGSETLNLFREIIALNPIGKTLTRQKATNTSKSSGSDNNTQTENPSDQQKDQPTPPPNRPETTAGRTGKQNPEHPKVMNGPWNNSVIQVEQYLKRNLFDAESFEALKWGMVTENTRGYQVDCTYRSKNLFGTLTTQTRTFYLNKKGDVYQVRETDKPK